ncbi:murein L,D-transpeptidase catalytic domain family protein [Phocaeicola sp.]|nr:murein L,D-transpeptidase catalytic domain family protein [Bacteroides sp.]
MQKAFLFLFLFFLPLSNVSTRTATPEKNAIAAITASGKIDGEQLFEDMQLGGVVNFLAFRQAVAGYNKIEKKSKSILTLIDFTKPSTEKRLFVFDMKEKKLLYSSVVSHGKNSGENYATSFSNEVGSYKSSLGFYLTGSTYQGKNGYSLLLDGLEKGINDRARERAIVVHGAAYANPSVCRSGRLGRSFGCPALPQNLTKPIINTIKGGSVLFIYANNKEYMAKSSILPGQQPQELLSYARSGERNKSLP